MAKIILILSIVAMGAAIFLGIKNRTALIELKTGTITLNKETENTYVEAQDVAANAMSETNKLKTEKATHDENRAAIASKTREVESSEAAITAADSDIANVQSEIDGLQAKLDEVDADPDQIQQQLDDLEKGIVVAQEEAETLQKEIDLARSVVTRNIEGANVIAQRLEDRRKAIGANQLTISVRDVNDEYGFVILNAGKAIGISEQSQFLILRGGTLIAKVGAASVENGITIANVVPGSVVEGASILRGDSAILATVKN